MSEEGGFIDVESDEVPELGGEATATTSNNGDALMEVREGGREGGREVREVREGGWEGGRKGGRQADRQVHVCGQAGRR